MPVTIKLNLATAFGPSAYASGALVKCRKVGAANWGNKSEGLSWDELTEKFRTQYGDKTKLSQSSERKSIEENPLPKMDQNQQVMNLPKSFAINQCH